MGPSGPVGCRQEADNLCRRRKSPTQALGVGVPGPTDWIAATIVSLKVSARITWAPSSMWSRRNIVAVTSLIEHSTPAIDRPVTGLVAHVRALGAGGGVLLRVLVKRLLASLGAEVIGAAFVE